MIDYLIADLVCYGLATGLLEREDSIYAANRLLCLLRLDALNEEAQERILEFEALDDPDVEEKRAGLESILEGICDYAAAHGLLEADSVTYRDLFDTEVMGILTDRPANISRTFMRHYENSPLEATQWYYQFSQDTNYIRRYRIARDQKWKTSTRYGDLDITINLSKPEKDPRAIAAARSAAQTAYPKCQLCRENVGYAGRADHPARANHRIIPVTINGSPWFLQYSPYVYYNEHCIVFNGKHTPMRIDRSSFAKLLDFVRQFPHYFVGSNADLPIVGGSILSHDHFQGGHYTFPMAKAPVEEEIHFQGFDRVKAGIVRWPMSVIRISAPDPRDLIELADRILLSWRGYTDEEAFIFAQTDGEPHNTITPIARRRGDLYELDLVLRNNITTPEHPLGVYHPHSELHHIKKENIGLIEVMGLAVLPARLQGEMKRLRQAILEKEDIRGIAEIEKHADWAEEIVRRYGSVSEDNIDRILQDEIGAVFETVLEHAGVYKRNAQGREAFLRFIGQVK